MNEHSPAATANLSMMETVKKPSVVVGISTYNRADVLRKSIQSALDQSHHPLRVAVIDDASTDATPSLRPEFPAVSWERFATNQGYVRARNKMMLTAPEDYYVSLDDDAWFLAKDEIALAIDYLERHPNVAAVAFDIVSPDRPNSNNRGKKTSVALFIGCGHVLRLSLVKKLGGYGQFPGSYGVEEADFCLRLIDAGYAIVRLEGVHVWHDKSMVARDTERQLRSSVCNDLTLTIWRYPNELVLQVLAWKIMSNLLFAIRRGSVRASLLGMKDFVRSGRAAWRSRFPVRRTSIARFRSLNKEPMEVVE
jgi:GT2 family glycosyltransferase